MERRRLKKIAIINIISSVDNFLKIADKNIEERKNDIIDVSTSLYNMVEFNEPNKLQKSIKNIIDNNNDCVYNGKVYRKFALNGEEIVKKMGFEFYKDELTRAIKECIKTGEYQSTTKDIKVAKRFTPVSEDANNNINITIEFECSNGLDIQEIAKKYKKLCSDLINELTDEEDKKKLMNRNRRLDDIQAYEFEKEVFAYIPDNYNIISLEIPLRGEEFSYKELSEELSEELVYKIANWDYNKKPQKQIEDNNYSNDVGENQLEPQYEDSIDFDDYIDLDDGWEI